MQKLLVLIAVAGSAMLGSPAGASQAGTYPPLENIITVDDPTVLGNQIVHIAAQCFEPGSTVSFSVAGSGVGQAVADADGVASLAYTVPPGTGDIVVTASGTGCDGSPLALDITLTRVTTAGGGGDLPRTGTDSTVSLAQLGVGVAAVGVLLVLVTRKRRAAVGA